MNDKKIDKIQQELKQLSQKHLELEKTQQQRFKSHEEQKTLYQHLFGQPPLHPDHTPFEQYGSIIGGVYLMSRSLFRSYHAVKAIEFPPDSQERFYHSFLARATG